MQLTSQNLTKLNHFFSVQTQGLIAKRLEKEKVLSSSFWYYIYNDEDSDMSKLVAYFTRIETNEVLQSVPEKHKRGLQYLLKRMAVVKSHPCMALWYVFWDDFWDCNKDLEAVKEKEDLFNPKNASSLAYKPRRREELEGILKETGLLSEKKFFSKDLLNTLYNTLDKKNQEEITRSTSQVLV